MQQSRDETAGDTSKEEGKERNPLAAASFRD
jgi:hypothetical protein